MALHEQRRVAGVPSRLDARSIDSDLAETVLWALKRSDETSEVRTPNVTARNGVTVCNGLAERCAHPTRSSQVVDASNTAHALHALRAGAHPAVQQGAR